MPNRTFLAAALCAALTMAGCGASPRHMTKASGPPGPLPADKARLVFMRPSGLAFALTQTILDEKGRFIGDIAAKTQFAADVEPGKRMYVVWAENAGPLQADLKPGHCYLVHVSIRMGVWSARAHLLAYRPGATDWDDRDKWLSTLEWWQPDQPAGQAAIDARRSDVEERNADAKAAFAKLDSEEQAARTLRAEDGFPPEQLMKASKPAPTAP